MAFRSLLILNFDAAHIELQGSFKVQAATCVETSLRGTFDVMSHETLCKSVAATGGKNCINQVGKTRKAEQQHFIAAG